MRILLLLLFISTQLNAQYCDCGIKTIRSKWPKSAEENNIYGIVEIKYKLTDSCIIIDPVIIKGLPKMAIRLPFNPIRIVLSKSIMQE